MNAHSFPVLVDALDCPTVQAGLLDGYISAGPRYHQALRRLRPIAAYDLVSEALAYHDSMRGAWEATPDGIAAWLLAQEDTYL